MAFLASSPAPTFYTEPMTFNDMLTSFVSKGASDIHLHAGMYPMARLSGRLVPVGETKLSPRRDRIACRNYVR